MARLLAYTSTDARTRLPAGRDAARAASPRPRGPRAHPGGGRRAARRARVRGRAGRPAHRGDRVRRLARAVAGQRDAADREPVRGVRRARDPRRPARRSTRCAPTRWSWTSSARAAATSPPRRGCRGRSTARTRRRSRRATRRRTGLGSGRRAGRSVACRDRVWHAAGRPPARAARRRSATRCGPGSACRRCAVRRPVARVGPLHRASRPSPTSTRAATGRRPSGWSGPEPGSPPAEPPDWLDAETRPIVLVTASTAYQKDDKLISTALEAFAGEDVALVVTTAAHDPAAFDRPGQRPRRAVPAPRPDHRARRLRRLPRRPGRSRRRRWPPASRCASCRSAATSSTSRAASRWPMPASGCTTSGSPRSACASAVREAIGKRAGAERVARGFAAAGRLGRGGGCRSRSCSAPARGFGFPPRPDGSPPWSAGPAAGKLARP